MSNAAQRILDLARAGDARAAIAAGETVLAAGARDAPLAMFIGVMCCREGDLARGIEHLERACGWAPDQMPPRVELARALVIAQRYGEAEALTKPLAGFDTPLAREMQRIRALAILRQHRADEAGDLYRTLADVDPGDFESWHGWGVAQLALEQNAGAITALEKATALRPTIGAYWVDLARARAANADFAGALAAAQGALKGNAEDPAALVELARGLAGQGDDAQALIALDSAAQRVDHVELKVEIADLRLASKAFDAAEADYRAVLERNPGNAQAWQGLARLLERTNRRAALFQAIEQAKGADLPPETLALVEAQALRDEKRLDEAMAAALQAPADREPALRAQLIGDIADRQGDTETAFAAFRRANALLAAKAGDASEQAERFRESYVKLGALVSSEWLASWREREKEQLRRAPLFIFGFPRSGTTLIDTMLSGHPDVAVMEEEAVIDRVAQDLGPFERLPTLAQADLDALRRTYFEQASAIVPDLGDRLIVDKHPLGLGSTPLLYRMFPDARFVFVERHPCDVVLSCFITSAQMDAKIANFFDFSATARLYDAVLDYWTKCTRILPINVLTIRYESLIADPAAELGRLANFAGLAWDDRLLANDSNASARGYIDSPSYAQVAQPIYTRARGRWLRYREHMKEVLPILEPWVRKLNYDLGK